MSDKQTNRQTDRQTYDEWAVIHKNYGWKEQRLLCTVTTSSCFGWCSGGEESSSNPPKPFVPVIVLNLQVSVCVAGEKDGLIVAEMELVDRLLLIRSVVLFWSTSCPCVCVCVCVCATRQSDLTYGSWLIKSRWRKKDGRKRKAGKS